jgi:hypothetical protein
MISKTRGERMALAKNRPATRQRSAGSNPVSSFPKQAIVVIHGMGEQIPMDTIRGFVHAVWETDNIITANGLPDPAEVWSKPDLRTGSLELRRITTRESIATKTFATGVRSDFYELYWADLSGGSTWSEVEDWIAGLLLRNPFTRVPHKVIPAWIVLWIAAICVIALAVATALPHDASIGSFKPWDYPPLKWLAGLPGWQIGLATAALGAITHWFVVPYFGRVVRYTRTKPDNIAARKNIRERGLALLAELHRSEYERIIVVGHSLGSIVAYDLISYFWAARTNSHTIIEKSPEFAALCTLESVTKELARTTSPAARESQIKAYLEAQREFCRLLRLRPKPTAKEVDTRWLITDLITLGSPLTHAEFLLASSKSDLESRKERREFPTSPPLRERLDPAVRDKAKLAGLPVNTKDPRLFCFPFGKGKWQLHHAAPYAAVRWTNIHDPALLIFFGDLISGPVAPVFGPTIIDVDLRKLRGQSLAFTHTRYWSEEKTDHQPPWHIAELRAALDLAGKDRLL